MDDRVGGEIYEQSADGRVTWGTITAWDAPESFSSTWHPGYGAELATQLTVRFMAEGPSTTRVELEHRGWEIHGEETAERFQGYTVGWDPVLATVRGTRRRLKRNSRSRPGRRRRGPGVRARRQPTPRRWPRRRPGCSRRTTR